MENTDKKKEWKSRAIHEFREYWYNVVYLAIFFSIFALSRRLILAHHNIVLDDYFIGLIKALVLAKVVMIGNLLRIDRGFESKPLIVPSIYKSFLFTIWIAIFDLVEAYIRGLIEFHSFSQAYTEGVTHHFSLMWLGGALMVFMAFIPYFAFREMGRVIGRDKVYDLFFSRRKNDL
jgi:hypothetical protein